jgi:Holliday junction DNA helicase RuvA
LHTYLDLATREETLDLYGFATADELAFFKELIKVSGVGPRSALGCLSVAKLDDLKRTIAQGDPKLLQKVAGIGKKIAERIVVELREKIGTVPGGVRFPLAGGDSDVVDALKGLGYREREVLEVLKGLPKEVEGSEARVKEVLKRLGKRR